MDSYSGLLSLDDNVLECLLSFLAYEDLQNLQLSCRTFHASTMVEEALGRSLRDRELELAEQRLHKVCGELWCSVLA